MSQIWHDLCRHHLINGMRCHAPYAVHHAWYLLLCFLYIFDCNPYFGQLPDDCFTRSMKLWVAIKVQDLIQFHQSTYNLIFKYLFVFNSGCFNLLQDFCFLNLMAIISLINKLRWLHYIIIVLWFFIAKTRLEGYKSRQCKLIYHWFDFCSIYKLH